MRSTAMALDTRKIFFFAQIMFFSHKKVLKREFFSIFSTLNQYFPYNPYVASNIDFDID
jgi:hypothetical protein